MVTTIRFDALPRLRRESNHQNRVRIILYGLGLVLTLILQEVGLFVSMIGYIVLNVARSAMTFWRILWNAGTEPDAA
jgi:hypothetical protein